MLNPTGSQHPQNITDHNTQHIRCCTFTNKDLHTSLNSLRSSLCKMLHNPQSRPLWFL